MSVCIITSYYIYLRELFQALLNESSCTLTASVLLAIGNLISELRLNSQGSIFSIPVE